MVISVNGKEHTLQSGNTLKSLMEELNLLESKGTAVAVNQKVVPRKDWEARELNQTDKIILIKATQGG